MGNEKEGQTSAFLWQENERQELCSARWSRRNRQEWTCRRVMAWLCEIGLEFVDISVKSDKEPSLTSSIESWRAMKSGSRMIIVEKSGRRLRSAQKRRCRSERQCAVVMSPLRTIVRPTRRGAWIGRTYFCTSRHNSCKTSSPGHCGLGFRKEMFVHSFSPNPFWVFLSGYVLGTEGLGTFARRACFH